jgi:hypothetical protein
MKRLLILQFLLIGSVAIAAFAHEVRPAYLELRQTGAETYDAVWKVPGRGEDLRFGVYVRLPANCQKIGEVRTTVVNNAFSDRWTINCTGGLAGGTILIEGLSSTVIDVLVRVERLDGSEQVTRLAASSPSFIVEAAPHRLEVARTYLVLGIEHILTGIDHLLFVSGLLLLVTGFRRLLLTVSAFTLSHTVTLTLATLGFVHAPPAPIEAVIALSIVFVAYEVLRKKENPDGLAQRKPWLGGLSAAGLPAAHIPLALGFFSAGVEVGHFSFVAVAVALIAAVRRWTMALPAWSSRVPPYAIGSVAAYWLIVRLAAF